MVLPSFTVASIDQELRAYSTTACVAMIICCDTNYPYARKTKPGIYYHTRLQCRFIY